MGINDRREECLDIIDTNGQTMVEDKGHSNNNEIIKIFSYVKLIVGSFLSNSINSDEFIKTILCGNLNPTDIDINIKKLTQKDLRSIIRLMISDYSGIPYSLNHNLLVFGLLEKFVPVTKEDYENIITLKGITKESYYEFMKSLNIGTKTIYLVSIATEEQIISILKQSSRSEKIKIFDDLEKLTKYEGKGLNRWSIDFIKENI